MESILPKNASQIVSPFILPKRFHCVRKILFTWLVDGRSKLYFLRVKEVKGALENLHKKERTTNENCFEGSLIEIIRDRKKKRNFDSLTGHENNSIIQVRCSPFCTNCHFWRNIRFESVRILPWFVVGDRRCIDTFSNPPRLTKRDSSPFSPSVSQFRWRKCERFATVSLPTWRGLFRARQSDNHLFPRNSRFLFHPVGAPLPTRPQTAPM